MVLERLALSWDQERGQYWRGRHCLGIKREGSTGEVDIVLGSREGGTGEVGIVWGSREDGTGEVGLSWDQERGRYWRCKHCLGIKRGGWGYWRGKHCLGIKRERVVLER